MVYCGGHSINENEYLYARNGGGQLGLRELNICTGCWPDAMEAPMEGAAIGHAQQLYRNSHFIGIIKSLIIVSKLPNPLINELVIMPDIEKKLGNLRAYRHGIIIFLGSVGTAEKSY